MEKNQLYPIFLKVTDLEVLVVGGGFVALEKISFMLKSSPEAKITMISPMYRPETIERADAANNVTRITGKYSRRYLKGKHIVIATTDVPVVNLKVYNDCKKRSILVNLADNPPYCDFYMGGIVTKGNVKIAISTNGKSPTMAKRLRQFFEVVLPDNIDDLSEYLNKYRDTIKGNFEEKVEKMNEFTKKLVGDVKNKIKE